MFGITTVAITEIRTINHRYTQEWCRCDISITFTMSELDLLGEDTSYDVVINFIVTCGYGVWFFRQKNYRVWLFCSVSNHWFVLV